MCLSISEAEEAANSPSTSEDCVLIEPTLVSQFLSGITCRLEDLQATIVRACRVAERFSMYLAFDVRDDMQYWSGLHNLVLSFTTADTAGMAGDHKDVNQELDSTSDGMADFLHGEALVSLDNGRWAKCSAKAQIGDAVVAAPCWDDCLLLRENTEGISDTDDDANEAFELVASGVHVDGLSAWQKEFRDFDYTAQLRKPPFEVIDLF